MGCVSLQLSATHCTGLAGPSLQRYGPQLHPGSLRCCGEGREGWREGGRERGREVSAGWLNEVSCALRVVHCPKLGLSPLSELVHPLRDDGGTLCTAGGNHMAITIRSHDLL